MYIICRFPWFSWLFHDFPYFHRDIGDVMAGMLAWESCEVSQYMETVQAGSKQWKHSQVWIELYNVYCMHVYLYLYLYLYIYRDFIEGCISSFPEKIKDLWMWYSGPLIFCSGFVIDIPKIINGSPKVLLTPPGEWVLQSTTPCLSSTFMLGKI